MDITPSLRPVIRETMKLAPNRKWTVKALHAQIRAEFITAEEHHVTKALRWNQERGFVDYTYNAEFERDEWHLTERGNAAE
jgi:hypothetical protein